MADAGVGRVYLPHEWLTAAGVAPDGVGAPNNRVAVHGVTLRLLDEADRYYASAYHGLPDLPMRSALAIAAARRIYADIGTVVRTGGPDGSLVRAKTGSARKMMGLAAAGLDTITARTLARLRHAPPRVDLWTMPRL